MGNPQCPIVRGGLQGPPLSALNFQTFWNHAFNVDLKREAVCQHPKNTPLVPRRHFVESAPIVVASLLRQLSKRDVRTRMAAVHFITPCYYPSALLPWFNLSRRVALTAALSRASLAPHHSMSTRPSYDAAPACDVRPAQLQTSVSVSADNTCLNDPALRCWRLGMFVPSKSTSC